jgi:hypothetical protein
MEMTLLLFLTAGKRIVTFDGGEVFAKSRMLS